METNKELIESVLKKDTQDIAFEPIPEENISPLAQPVVQKSNTSGDVNAAKNEAKDTSNPAEENKEEPKVKAQEKLSDAPEQEINADPPSEEEKKGAGSTSNEEGEFSMPLEHAGLMADSIIGTINNTILEVGAGYFVTISKHKDFYDFEELIQVIDEQNAKNIKRIKLDDEDKALLRPLLIHILRKKAAALSPEKQLLMVAISIIVKKAKVVIEIRMENQMLVERIRDIIRKEVRGYEEEKEAERKSHEETSEHEDESEQEEVEEVVYEEIVRTSKTNNTGLPDSVLEKMG
ncbi:MAG: hypothetical protein HY062_05990 [Bacteroidetes bacterium]|nr:hypothetical protein [Bacteroidota bacterium]